MVENGLLHTWLRPSDICMVVSMTLGTLLYMPEHSSRSTWQFGKHISYVTIEDGSRGCILGVTGGGTETDFFLLNASCTRSSLYH